MEQLYTPKTPLEHVLLRPGMYVGPTERDTHSDWVLHDAVRGTPSSLDNGLKKKNLTLKKVDCDVVPALQKIFYEILVNVSNNRHRKSSTRACTRNFVLFPSTTAARAFP